MAKDNKPKEKDADSQKALAPKTMPEENSLLVPVSEGMPKLNGKIVAILIWVIIGTTSAIHYADHWRDIVPDWLTDSTHHERLVAAREQAFHPQTQNVILHTGKFNNTSDWTETLYLDVAAGDQIIAVPTADVVWAECLNGTQVIWFGVHGNPMEPRTIPGPTRSVKYRVADGDASIVYCIYRGSIPPAGWYQRALYSVN